MPDHRHGTSDQQPSEIGITLFGYPPQPFLATGRVLFRHKPYPGGKVAAGFELARIGCCCGHGRRTDHADAGNAFQALGDVAGAMLPIDSVIQSVDLFLQRKYLIYKCRERVNRLGRQCSS